MDFTLSQEQRDIRQAVREFAKGELTKERALGYEERHEFPRDLYRAAAELGFIGLDYPEEVGGGGLGVMENVLVIEELCKADSGIGLAIHLAFLPAKIVKLFGTPLQQQRYLAPLTRGEIVSAISLTEPDHGSDLTRMNTTVEDQGDRLVLNGTKIFTTNGAYADFFIVLAQDDPNAKPGRGMTTVLVDRDPSRWLGGELEINEISGKMGLKMTSSSELVFKELEVPKENVLGEPGRGLLNVLDFLDQSRIEIAAQSLGIAEGAFLAALRHARTRHQFGKPLIDLQAIGHLLARMHSRLHSAKLATYYAAWACDQGGKKLASAMPLYTSMVKHHVPETAKSVIDDAITVFGGYGYFIEQDVERRYRDNRIIEIYEGTVQVQLNNMVRVLKKLNLDFIDTTLL
jgi:alkylation response protein AidB-like acyl-CoA dehydrogenase